MGGFGKFLDKSVFENMKRCFKEVFLKVEYIFEFFMKFE